MNDLFQTKSVPVSQTYTTVSPGASIPGSITTTVMNENLQRIYAFACSQVSSTNGPDIVNLIQILQKIPRSINYPDKFFAWIERFTDQMSPFMVKNAQFNDAVAHF